MNKISICGVAVISNPSVCDVCLFHTAVFGEMKLFAVLWFLVSSFSDLNLARNLFGSTSQSCSWTFIQTSSPGKYRKTDLRVSTVSTHKHTLTNMRFHMFISRIIVQV